MPSELWSWGPAIVVLLGVYLLMQRLIAGLGTASAGVVSGLSKLLDTALTEFVAAQKEMARAMSSQADSLSELTSCLQVQRADAQGEMREMMIMLKVLRQEVRDLSGGLMPPHPPYSGPRVRRLAPSPYRSGNKEPSDG